jgi:hypothetical protein
VTGDACGRGRSRRYTEDHSRTPDVRVHARRRDAELVRDLFRRKTGGHRPKDLALPVRQQGIRSASIEDAPGYQVARDKPDEE